MSKFNFITKSMALLLAVCMLISPAVQARQPDLVADSAKVPINQTNAFTVYFKYGSRVSPADIGNAAASIVIDGPGFEIVPDSLQDWFNGDPNRPDNEEPPADANCNSSFAGNKYNIPSTFVSSQGKNFGPYGLQSAYSNASNTATLRQGATGCLVAKIRVASNAQIGNKANLIFDWDASKSPDLQESERPGLQIIPLEVSEAVNASSASSTPAPASSAASVTPVASSTPIVQSSMTQTNTTRSGGFEVTVIVALISLALVLGVFYKTRQSQIKISAK